MKTSRFTDEQRVRIVRDADKMPARIAQYQEAAEGKDITNAERRNYAALERQRRFAYRR